MIKRLSSISRWIVCGTLLTFGAIQANAQDATNAATATPAPAAATPAPAAAAAPAAAPAPTTDQRISDLEAYVNNGAVGANSKLTGSGPGHNAWMMTSTALVLMMTLPGLALFYGGLVRRKNVLSVCAQCFVITGLVTILWWLCGYSLVFGVNHAYTDPKTGA